MCKHRTDRKFTRYQQDAKKLMENLPDREMVLAGNTEISVGQWAWTEIQLISVPRFLGTDALSRTYQEVKEVPYAGQMQSRIFEVC